MDVIQQIENEDAAKAKLAAIFPPEKVNTEFDRLVIRKMANAARTAETVLIILEEMEQHGPA